MKQTQANPIEAGPNRRQVLCGGVVVAAGVGAAAALTACGGGEPGTQPSAAAPSSAGSNSITVPKADVPVGAGVILQEPYVVTQPSEGQFKAFTSVCPHQGCTVSLVRNGSIVCACHTSLFDIANGQPTSGPARRGLTEVPVVDNGDALLIG